MMWILQTLLLLIVGISCAKKPTGLNEQDEYELTINNANTQFNSNNPTEFNQFFSDFPFKPIPPEEIYFPIDPDKPINNHILNKPECDIANADNREELLKVLGLPADLDTQKFYYSYIIDETIGKILFTSISIKNIELYKIPDLKCFSALEYLSFTGNQLTALDLNTFQNLPGLLFLDLSNNQFTQVPEAIKYLTKLVTLSFAQNKINDLNERVIQYNHFENLKTLILSSNQINNIAPLAQIPALEGLYLSNNKLDLQENLTLSPFANQKLNVLDLSAQNHTPSTISFPEQLLTDAFANLSILYYRNNSIDIAAINEDFLNKLAQKAWIGLYLEYNHLNSKSVDNIQKTVQCKPTNSIVIPNQTDPMVQAAITAGLNQGLTLSNQADGQKECLYLKPQR